ncbi:MAG TPA: hypothetical protein VFH71_06570 [Rhodanobacteraceae bacterium]|nr:hypothetical protein [Rhodanobacteraceae bacterium]
MTGCPRHVLALALACGLLLAGCASPPRRSAAIPNSGASHAVQPAPLIPSNGTGTAPNEQLPPAPNGMVGVASCDQYLSTYKACHRAAGIFAPDQIEAHYELMRDSLRRDARDPVKRATLDQRCTALSRQLQEALHGKSCGAAPAPASTGGRP